MQLIKILFLEISVLAFVGCAGLPAAPVGNTCIVDVANRGSDCVAIAHVIHNNGSVADVKSHATSFIPFEQMDNWVAFDPVTWGHIQVYIGELKQLARNCPVHAEAKK